VALLLFSWSAFLGADIAFRENKLVNVDVVFTRLPRSLQKTVELIMYLIVFIFLVALVYLGIKLSVTTWHRTFQGIPGLSYTWVTLSIPVTSLSMITTIVIKMYKSS
jgi:TRAP-type C4-dicarboxylate transport system permease small subunit